MFDSSAYLYTSVLINKKFENYMFGCHRSGRKAFQLHGYATMNDTCTRIDAKGMVNMAPLLSDLLEFGVIVNSVSFNLTFLYVRKGSFSC